MLKKTLITTSLIAILFFGLGLFSGLFFSGKIKPKPNQLNVSPVSDNASQTQLDRKNIALEKIATQQAKTTIGKVEKISKDGFTLKSLDSTDPLFNTTSDNRFVKIVADTKFFKLVQKDCSQFQKETEDFQRKIKESDGGILQQNTNFPQLQEKIEIGFSDIKIGDVLVINSNENIGEKNEITPSEIIIQSLYLPLL